MSENNEISIVEEMVQLEELAPVLLFSVSGGCSAGSDGWKCEVKATENT